MMEDLTFPPHLAAASPSSLPEALQSPIKRVSIGFMLALTLANTVLFMCYVGIGGLLLPLQISTLEPAHKVVNLGIVTSLSVLLALVGNPLAGALSDRTTSRLGRRRPWIVVGAILSAASLLLMMNAQAIWMIFVGWAAFQLFSNFILAALTAIIPDQVPVEQRGAASGLVGIAIAVASIVGSVVVGQVLKSPTPSYMFLLIVLLVILIPYAVFLREKTLPREYVGRFRLGAFLANFWINPIKHSDFGWAWLARFIPFFGYFLGTNYLFFYLQDAVHYTTLFPGQSIVQAVSLLTIISTLVALVFTPLGGFLSDLFSTRKLFVVIANIIIAAAMISFGTVPSWTSIMVTMGVLGMGFGIYTAVDSALVTQVLPSANNRAKDMGIMNIANTLPQSLAPATAALIISTSHSYLVLFVTGAAIALFGMFSVLPIKSVR